MLIITVQSVKAEINGQIYTLTRVGTTDRFEATITAPTQTSAMNSGGVAPGVGAAASGKGYYAVKLTATDDAGNVTTVDDTDSALGEHLKLKVKETVAPVMSFTSPTSGSTITSNKPAIGVSVSDSGSGVNPTTCKIQIDSGTEQAVTLTGSGATLTGTFTPSTALSDGSHTVTVYAYDYDGNKSNVATTTFTIDTTPPVLSVTAPADNLRTNATKVTVTGTTNDVTSSPVTLTMKLNTGNAVEVSVGTDGKFSHEFTLVEGTNTITVTATDGAGKTSSVTRTVILDTGAPVFGVPTITPNPTETGMQYTISVEVTDA